MAKNLNSWHLCIYFTVQIQREASLIILSVTLILVPFHMLLSQLSLKETEAKGGAFIAFDAENMNIFFVKFIFNAKLHLHQILLRLIQFTFFQSNSEPPLF